MTWKPDFDAEADATERQRRRAELADRIHAKISSSEDGSINPYLLCEYLAKLEMEKTR